MEDEGEVHPAVQLLLSRMDSHPEEFKDDRRWAQYYQPFKVYWSGDEKRLFTAKLRSIRMGLMHEQLMDNLLKGANK
jgi:hypothetical protein